MNLKKIIIALLVGLASAMTTHAQYYQIANQLTSLLSPALSGSFKYRGFVDANGLAGLGDNRANFVGISTTQGFQYASWFFMGAGIGIDMAKGQTPEQESSNYYSHSSASTKAILPVFSDFRFKIGSESSTSVFIDIKLGAAWLIGNRYLQLDNARLTTATQFYAAPSAGVRIPVNSKNAKQAFNIGLTYQLLTANNSYYDNTSVSLNSLGLTIGFEW